MFKEFSKQARVTSDKYQGMSFLELQKNGWRTMLAFFIIDVAYKLIRNIKIHETKVNSLTIVDYIIVGLILCSLTFLLLKNITKKDIYLKVAIICGYLNIDVLLISSLWMNSSYINYGWKFPLHEYIFPLVPPITFKSHGSWNSWTFANYTTTIIFGLILLGFSIVLSIIVIKTVIKHFK